MKYSIWVLAFLVMGFAQSGSIQIGKKVPSISLKNPDRDTTFHLDSLNGKIVLIDFWASWCVPCRESNPELVKVYQKFKNLKYKTADGFTIYSFSLDKDIRSWKKAIEEDKLTWPYHVGDQREWRSPTVRQYGVDGIPSSFLIDEKGKLIAVNPTMGQLKYQLSRRKLK